MNWKKLYISTRKVIFVGAAAITSGGFYSFVIAGICRIVFKLEENAALIWIGLPIFVVTTTLTIIYFPRAMRKAGLME